MLGALKTEQRAMSSARHTPLENREWSRRSPARTNHDRRNGKTPDRRPRSRRVSRNYDCLGHSAKRFHLLVLLCSCRASGLGTIPTHSRAYRVGQRHSLGIGPLALSSHGTLLWGHHHKSNCRHNSRVRSLESGRSKTVSVFPLGRHIPTLLR